MTSPPSLLAAIQAQARAQPHKVAMCCAGRSLSYADLYRRIAMLHGHLQLALPPRSPVALCSRDPLWLSSVFLALGAGNHNALIFNPAWPQAMQRAAWQRLQPALWLGDELPAWAHGHTRHSLEPAPDGHGGALVKLQEAVARRDTGALFYTGFTSGSSGVPKGFSRHERSWLASFAADQRIFGFSAGQVFYCPGSLAHSLFLYAVMRALYAGATVQISDEFRPARCLAQLRASADVLFAVPTQLQALAGAAREPVPGLRKILSSGAKLHSGALAAINKAFPQAQVCEFYGSSELSYISVAGPGAPRGSVGKPLPGVRVSVCNSRGEALPAGEKGLIYVDSELVFEGYAGPQGGTHREALAVCQAGISCRDIGYLDTQGNLFITGRADRMMLVAGRNVYPEEIEQILQAHPDVHQVAVLPQADQLRETRPVALLNTSPDVCRKTLLAYCRQHLPAWSVPTMYYRVRHWPLTVSAKTDFPALQALLAQGRLEPL
ncbi:AMP-binding protein [Granulosicoccaceae sp. 1_MG-2023]|nr:AMP-binding protein [Granulosicoccaceae sp. 1_MG-2023]